MKRLSIAVIVAAATLSTSAAYARHPDRNEARTASLSQAQIQVRAQVQAQVQTDKSQPAADQHAKVPTTDQYSAKE